MPAPASILGARSPRAPRAPKVRERASYLRGWEHRRESDERVEQNLDPFEIDLWRKLRGQFKGTPHARLEAFRKYVEEHPRDIYAFQQKRSEARVEATVKLSRDLGGVEVPCAPPWRYRTRELCKLFRPRS